MFMRDPFMAGHDGLRSRDPSALSARPPAVGPPIPIHSVASGPTWLASRLTCK